MIVGHFLPIWPTKSTNYRPDFHKYYKHLTLVIISILLPECLNENFQARGMPRQFEQPEDSNDRKEFEDIRIFQMGGHLLKH